LRGNKRCYKTSASVKNFSATLRDGLCLKNPNPKINPIFSSVESIRMKIVEVTTYLSATDLSTHMSCRHATWLNLQEAKRLIKAPIYNNPTVIALRQKGEEFEKNYIEQLKKSGMRIVEISKDERKRAFTDTLEAMRQGADVIYQARMEDGTWNGWADFLLKVNKESKFGNWSYEVLDTKLSKETKAGAILQISLYSEILEQLQGSKPEYMHIHNPNGEEHYRVDDFAAYYRLMKAELLHAIEQQKEQTYPDPVPHCDVCRWWQVCNQRRRSDDHLSFIAGMGGSQMREVNKWGVTTLESVAELPLPLTRKPERGSAETFQKLANQARLQFQWRMINQPVFETLPVEEEFGFYKLPEPSEHDIFFDFEGDPYVGNTGLEYLFGWYYRDNYYDIWASHDAEEKQALEQFMDTVMKIWELDTGMHIYHFGAYEQTALKRLVGKYSTKEDELDRLLRANVFVNLHSLTRQSIAAGVESYSLKDMEKLHGYLRIRDLRTVGPHKLLYEGLLESGSADAVDVETTAIVRDYNKDDCISTKYLRDWLEKQRQKLIDEGNDIPRPKPGEDMPSENITAHQERIQPLFDVLMKDIPFDKGSRTEEQHAKWLLANMLDWYRREQKSLWWEFYRLKELSDDELLDEKDSISKLEYTGKREFIKRSVIDYYEYPEQEFDMEPGSSVRFRGESVGTIVSLNRPERIIGIKKGLKRKDEHPTHIVCLDIIRDDVKQEAIIRLAEWVINNGLTGEGNYHAGRKLSLRNTAFHKIRNELFNDAKEEAIYRVKNLSEDILPIQGPPGTGKSHTAAQMIISLIQAGKKIGVTALSHKVITALLQKITEAAAEEKITVRITQKVSELSGRVDANWEETENDNSPVIANMHNGSHIAAGTSFMWARPEFFELVDYMFVDEAGQLSLLDTLALSHSCKNLVLLGDPQQLKQPQKGSHPEGTEVSALEHILQEEQTIRPEQGVFLDTTWRMHPAINKYISELFYDNRLETKSENVHQRLEGNTRYRRPGIYLETVKHFGNQSSSVEEVNRVVSVVEDLLKQGVYWIDSCKNKRELKPEDIKIIAPYNAQVNALQKALPHIQKYIGTVDKFQGQEAAVIIFSMATSTPEDAPRGMDFLYSLNRMNVAVSRARAIFILVAGPELFEPACRSPHQMKLANALCRLRELAVEIKAK